MKIKYVISFLLIVCCILSGCGNKDKASGGESAPNGIAAMPAHPSKAILIGQWEGIGYFDSIARRSEECKYILDFFEDGSMSLSSSNMYFYGYKVEDVSIHDGIVDFSIPYNNPVGNLDYIPIDYREMMKISMSLQIGKDELTGKAKQGEWGTDITFKKISDAPRSYEATDKLSTQQMAEDANVLFDILETKHPDIYYTQSQEDYEKRKAELTSSFPSLNKKSFLYELKSFVASIGDAHTSVSATEAMYQNEKILPFSIELFSGKWYVVGVYKQYEQLLGKEITAINDIPIDEVFTKVTAMSGHENKAGARLDFKGLINNADLLEYVDIISDGQAIMSTNGDERVVVSAVVRSEYNKGDEIKIGQSSETAYNRDNNYSYKSLNKDIFYIQYNSCTDSVDYPITKFGEEVASELTSNKYKKIVIDLRYNRGGNSDIINTFIDPVLKARDDGTQLYCLIGEETFSAAFDNAIMLDREGAMLVGQPTGGNMQQFTQVVYFELPNSRFAGQHATKFVNYDENAPYDSLYPDKQIDHTIEAYIKGIDEEIEYIKKQ